MKASPVVTDVLIKVCVRILAMRENWLRNKKEAERLVQAGVDDTVINAAMSAFVLETMAHHGEPAEVRADIL